MFETEVRKAARQGVKLHRRDGSEYWKLILTCTREGCENEVNMGDCLCFRTEEDMAMCRDTHGLHCSTECWYSDAPRSVIEQELKRYREYLDRLPPTDQRTIDWSREVEVLEEWTDVKTGWHDMADWYEDFEIDECPV